MRVAYPNRGERIDSQIVLKNMIVFCKKKNKADSLISK